MDGVMANTDLRDTPPHWKDNSKSWRSYWRDGLCPVRYQPGDAIDETHPYRGYSPYVVEIVGVLSVLALLYTLYSYYMTLDLFFEVASSTNFVLCETHRGSLNKLIGLVMFWSVVPPMWFWAEYFWIWQRCPQRGSEDALKYGQNLSAKIWAAVLAVQVAALAVLL